MTTHDELLYKKYKYYGFNENVTTLKLLRNIYDLPTNMVKVNMHIFKHCKFEGFYLIRFHSYYLNELKETMIYYGKDYTSLQDKLFILHYHLNFGYPNYHNSKEIIDEYCSVYDAFQKSKFIQRIRQLTVNNDPFCEKPTIDIKLSETEYKLLEKFLLKQLKFKNVIRIEHYPKKGFISEV